MPELTARFDQALLTASAWHRTQMRKASGVPYVAHLLSVAGIALEFGATEDEAIAALLHDALEDAPQNTGVSAPELKRIMRERFGPDVVRIVEGCTDSEPGPGEPKEAWVPRKRRYLASLAEKDAGTLLVSASDKLHNARAILLGYREQRDAVFARFTGGRNGTLWYYRSLADAYAHALNARPNLNGHAALTQLVREFTRTVADLEREAGVTPGDLRGIDLSHITG